MQQVWRHQRLLRDQLSTQDGRRLHVLHPGFWNREPGPDFLRALIQFEGGEIRAGDVELDRIPSGWRSHRHDGNPSYRRVILRVVWEAPLRGEREEPPVMVMKPVLDAPVPELLGWLSLEGPSALPVNVPGLCSAPLGKLPVDKAIEILQQAALSRLSRKAAELEARARHAGWEQVLWEGMAAGLGYKHNVWPMRRLAELMPWAPMEGAGSTPECLVPIQARLLGLGSFLTRPENRVMPDAYVRSLWDSWWRDREEWGSLGMPESVWRMAGIRPANHPQRRLALLAHWWCQRDWLVRMESWMSESMEPIDAALALAELLQPPSHDSFWGNHWTLGSARFENDRPLLGMPRCTDLAMNVILPWFWVRAGLGRDERMRALVLSRYLGWPAGEDNAVLRLARSRLFGGSPPVKLPRTAAVQQGLMQIVRDFCDHSDALCRKCEFPGMLLALGG